MKEAELLNERSKKFLKEAEDDIKKGFWDLAAFHLEQALQLKLKFLLAKRIGYFSKTHLLSELLKEIKKVFPSLSKFLLKEKEKVEELELAYTGARYLPIKYSKEDVKELLEFVKKAFREVEKHEG